MYRDERTGRIVFSPSDLTEFMESRYASFMSRLAVERPELEREDDSPQRRMLQRHGDAHERRVIERLRGEGRDLVEIEKGPDAATRTLEAMREGREVICQARLELAPFAGWADFLVRADDGDGYEVWEAKLARQTRPYFLVQLCSYAEMLEAAQGHLPERVHVVLGSGEIRAYRTDDYRFHFRALRSRFLAFMESFEPDAEPPLPEPGRDHRRWQRDADTLLEQRDHVTLVAGVGASQARRLAEHGIETLGGLATTHLERVPRMRQQTFERLVEQARLQLESRGRERPAFRVLSPPEDDPHKGLALLPPPSPSDVWFDIEGYPFGEIEYLWGAAVRGDDGLDYLDWWAHDAREEKRAFEGCVDEIHERWTRDPSMHVYHYGIYEVAALRRLMGRYGTRENEVDELLRSHVFVDLLALVRNGVRVGTPGYGLKELEALYMEARNGAVTSGADSILQYEEWIDSGQPRDWREAPLLRDIRDYNRADCVSTKELCDWLRERQAEAGVAYDPEPAQAEGDRPPDPALLARQTLARSMLEQIPEDRSGDPDGWHVHELLAQLLEFHRRETKPFWWAFFERLAMTAEQRADELDCLADLHRTTWPRFQLGRSSALEYGFDPEQETKVEEGQYYAVPQSPGGNVRLHELRRSEGKAIITFAQREAPPDHICLIPSRVIRATPIEESIHEAARAWVERNELRPALRDLLLRRPPRIAGHDGGPLLREDEDAQQAVLRLVRALDDSVLCIQGPPGSGKTSAAADAIVELVREGRVGITSNSHRAIVNLMERCLERAPGLACVKIGGDRDDPFLDRDGVEHAARARDVKLGDARLVGGTAWAFSAPELRDRIDWLFVDEAGQVPVANLAGMARSARNLVLLGDQMQLAQPIQGHHPGESGASTLDYLLQEHATIPPAQGVFLDQTWRLHPALCSFVSGAVYEGRLRPRPGNESRVVRVPQAGARHVRREAGLVFVPVRHEGNAQASDEEVERIAEIAQELVGREVPYLRDGHEGPLRLDDILFVAPYNLQVRRLRQRLGMAARVGSVDLFQGQQAPVVVVSMCSSEPAASARGLRFIFDRNRLNVAISRAFSLAIVVGSPALVGAPCSSPEEMALSNLFCRIAEEGRP